MNTKKRVGALIVLLLILGATVPTATIQASYCSYPSYSYPPTPQQCQLLYEYCMCDCLAQTGNQGLCMSACSSWIVSMGCQ